jgi:rhodanese-related sulfurtransferase
MSTFSKAARVRPQSENLGSVMRVHEPYLTYARDLIGVLCLALVSLAAGFIINRFRASPLPISYQSPEQRFDAELTTLIVAPPFKIAPTAAVGLDQFRSALAGKTTLIFDARPSSFYEEGHVPGAFNLARDNFAHDYRQLNSVLKGAQEKPIIVYCGGGDCHDSRLVANALVTLGYDDVSVFTGGWQVWSAGNLPVATGSNP